ncbi:2-oxo acid dehydrogenase subunit E2 [Thermodesulfobacteriota bacterium]
MSRMEKAAYRDPNEAVTSMTGVEKVHYSSMREITRNWSVCAIQLWDCSALLALLKERKAADRRITFATLIIKLVAATLEKEPKMGWMFRRWRLVKPSTIDIGCSVDTGSPVAPVVVVRDAARKSLDEINEELAKLAAEAKAGEAKEQEQINRLARWVPASLIRFAVRILLGLQKFRRQIAGNFQVTIIEKFSLDIGITAATCVSTLAVGSIRDHALVENGEVVVRPAAFFTLHFEHGICGAQDTASFFNELHRLIKNPAEVA